MEFFEAVVQGFRNAGIPAEYTAYGGLRVAGLTIACYVRRNSYYTLSRRFTRNQVEECTLAIVQALPRLLREKERNDARRAHEVAIRPAVLALRDMGWSVGQDGKTFTINGSNDDARELLKFLVAYQTVKAGGVHYDQGALLQCILDNPGDTTPVLVYADWLEENGHEADAMKLRNTVEEERNAS